MKKYFHAHDIRLITSGKNYFDTLAEIINSAKEVIHLQTYIFETDETGLAMVDLLKKAAQRGVRVFMMVDGFGSFPFDGDVADDLRNAGVNFRIYSHLFSSESVYLSRRMHHKIVVADKNLGIIGGINIANKYNDMPEERAWLDYAVLVQGNICEYLHILCEGFYLKKKKIRLFAWEKSFNCGSDHEQGHRLLRFRRNDWLKGYNEIHQSYVHSINRAESSIIIVASYFLPGRNFRKILRKAVERGVKIKVLMAGRSDISSARLAENFLYDFYIRHNIEIYEWEDSVMHGKAMIVDDTWATIGSYNLNYLSHYISIELNADVLDPVFVTTFSEHLNKITQTLNNSSRLKMQEQKKGWFLMLRRWLAYNFYRMIRNLLTMGKKFRNIDRY